MSTRLHYTLADQKGLAYSIHAAIEPLADAALFEIAGATANAKVPALVRELLVAARRPARRQGHGRRAREGPHALPLRDARLDRRRLRDGRLVRRHRALLPAADAVRAPRADGRGHDRRRRAGRRAGPRRRTTSRSPRSARCRAPGSASCASRSPTGARSCRRGRRFRRATTPRPAARTAAPCASTGIPRCRSRSRCPRRASTSRCATGRPRR